MVGRSGEGDVGSTCEEVTRYLVDHSWRLEVEEFADAVLNGKSLKHGNSSDALAVMNIVYSIYFSDVQWRESFDIEKQDL